MCLLNDTIIIVAVSGRMLAQSALQAGLTPIVIDLFADRDTRDAAEEVRLVEHFGETAILPVIEQLICLYDVRNVVYGSGIENFPKSLDLLAEKFNILGNTPKIIRQLLDKKKFFQTLDDHNILFPQVFFQSPQKNEVSIPSPCIISRTQVKMPEASVEGGWEKSIQNDRWLRKPVASQGGVGIQGPVGAKTFDLRQIKIPPPVEYYWQRFIAGIPMSVLFLADGQNMRIIGFSQQWTKPESFIFAGVISQAGLAYAEKELLGKWIALLVPVFELIGLNCLDFIWDGKSCWVLEINPRPSASMVLYDDDFPKGLFHEHIRACQGVLDFSPRGQPHVKATQILYAETELRVPEQITWPHWSQDRPAGNALISKHHPICSIIASGNSAQEVKNILRTRQQIMIKKFAVN